VEDLSWIETWRKKVDQEIRWLEATYNNSLDHKFGSPTKRV